MNLHEEIAYADKLNAAYKARIAELEAQLAARQPSDLQAAIQSRNKFERMFIAACEDLAAINENLGLDPDDGGAEPIIAAIEELRVAAFHAVVGQQWVSCKERIPPVLNKAYLVWCPNSKCIYTAYMDDEEFCWKYFANKSEPINERITHWSEIPPAPQPAQQEGV